MREKLKNQKGFSALVLVVLFGAIALLAIKTKTKTSLNELDMANYQIQEKKAFYAAEACVSEALYRTRQNSDFTTSSSTLSLGVNFCTMEVVDNPPYKMIYSSGQSGDFYKNIFIKILVGDFITIEERVET